MGTGVEFWVNNRIVAVTAESDLSTTLLNFLRGHLRLTGTKCGCNEGTCGSCTVIIDGKAAKSCLNKVSQLAGKRVQTIEALSADGKLHPIQDAFVRSGAVQCGFCTPGMIMSVKALLDRNKQPTIQDIRTALKMNLCRCGTYPRVIEAITMAAQMLRGEQIPEKADQETACAGSPYIGKAITRIDMVDKVKGATVYLDDMYFQDMLYGKVLWSSHPSAEICEIDTSEAMSMPGLKVVLTEGDIPGENATGVINLDQPVLAVSKVRSYGEMIAAVFATTEEQAKKAAEKVRVVYKELDGVWLASQALEPDSPLVHPEKGTNLLKEMGIRRGDLHQAFSQAGVQIDGDFSTVPTEHAFMETEGALAVPGIDGEIVVYSGTQGPFFDRDQLVGILGLPEDKVRVIHVPVGGAFGGKTELSTHALVALAVMRTGLPAKLVFDRQESLRFHPKRHGYDMSYKTKADPTGKILAMDIDFVSDGGAYDSWSPSVLKQSVGCCTGPYYVPNVQIRGRIIYTNNLIKGAMRGFGAIQPQFAVETQMDELAKRLGLDPIAIRRRNIIGNGLPTLTGQIFPGVAGISKTLDVVEKLIDLELVPLKGSYRDVGIGVASAWKSCGGSGLQSPQYARTGAIIELTNDGTVLVRVACPELGQGTLTSLCQITADTINCSMDQIRIIPGGDTKLTPFGGALMSSRGLFTWGHAVLECSKSIRKALLAAAALISGCNHSDLDIRRGKIVQAATGEEKMSFQTLAQKTAGQIKAEEYYRLPSLNNIAPDANEDASIDPTAYRTHHAFAYSTTAVAVQVDKDTGDTNVLKVLIAVDAGKVINPEGVRTQVEGSVIMGIGQALMEEFVITKGINVTNTLGKYRIPRINHIPEIRVEIVDAGADPQGPLGTKGVAEIGIIGVIPAITNAIYDAIGVRVRQLPANSKRIKELLAAQS